VGENFGEVPREGPAEFDRDAGRGMRETEARGVEERAVQRPDGRQGASGTWLLMYFGGSGRTIKRISGEGMA